MKLHFLLPILAILLGKMALAQSGPQNIDQLRVHPYLQYSTQHSMRILWETKEAASSRVEFGEAQYDVEVAPLPQVRELKGTRRMHEVSLENLKEESNYFWRIVSKTESGKTIISETFSFKTAVKDSSALFFALVGDTQKNNDTPWAWDSIAKKVWQERPHFIVHAGDLVDWGPKKTDWTQHFFPGGKDLMARIPMYTVLGNHEGDADLYYQYMANPQPEYRYTFRYGNAEFFMIDSNRDLSEGSEQYNWLEQALAQSEATWKIAIHHHPPYSSESNDHGDTYYEASRMGTHARDLTPLYDKYGVDFCLFGHTHVYERTWPLKNHRVNQRQGTIYINSGGAGGFLETFAPTRNWFTAEIQEAHHFCTFAIFDQTLLFKAIDDQGRVFDSFQMHKGRDKDELTLTEPPAPIIESRASVFHQSTQISLYQGIEGLNTYYTLDGSTPDQQSPLYQNPITLGESATVKARSFTSDGKASRVVSRNFQQTKPIPAQKVKTTRQGIDFQLFTGDWRGNKEGYFDSVSPELEGTLAMLSLEELNPSEEYWGVAIETYLKVPETGTYTFYALDSRGLTAYLDDLLLFDSDAEKQLQRQVVLEAGLHRLQFKSFQSNWRKSFSFGYYDPEQGRIPIKPFDLFLPE